MAGFTKSPKYSNTSQFDFNSTLSHWCDINCCNIYKGKNQFN